MVIMIILNYNDADTVFEFFKKADHLKSIDKFIVVDNCSTDNSRQLLDKIASNKIEIIYTEKNEGYASGNNFGLRYVVRKYPKARQVIISNPDIEITNNDLKLILDALDSGFDLATGLIYQKFNSSENYRLVSNFAWKIPTYTDMICNCFLLSYKIRRAVLHNSNYLNYNNYKKNQYIPAEAVPGCFFAANLESFREVDFFDEGTFLFGEETILGWRFKNAGKRCCVVNNTCIKHNASTSINKDSHAKKRKIQYRLDSECLYLKRYLKCNAIQLSLYKSLFKLGRIEQALLSLMIKLKN